MRNVRNPVTLRIPMISDTQSENNRTLIRVIRTVVGAERRSASSLTRVSELGQVFPALRGLFFGAEGDGSSWRTGGYTRHARRADQAIPKWGSADMNRAVEPQFAVHVVRLGPIWGWPGLRPPTKGRSLRLIRRSLGVGVEAGLGFADGLAFEVEAVCVVNQSIQNGVGHGGVVNDGVPLVDRKLAGD